MRTIRVFVGLTILVAFGAAGYLALQLKQSRVKLAVVGARNDRLRKVAWDGDRQARQLEAGIAAKLADASRDAAAALAVPPSPVLHDVRSSAFAARAKFSGFAAEHNLTLEQLDALASVIVDGSPTAKVTAIRNEQNAAGVTLASNPERYKQYQDRVAEYQRWDTDKIRAIIGPENYTAFSESVLKVDAQSVVTRDLEPRFEYAGVKLTPEQAAQLVPVLLETPDPSFTNAIGRPRPNVNGGNGTVVFLNNITPATLERAAAFLSPAQLQVLQRVSRTLAAVHVIEKRDADEAAAAKAGASAALSQ